ncbi:MAG: hypothetical protein ACJKTH_03355 [Patescibacteria group bacterium UBA2163]
MNKKALGYGVVTVLALAVILGYLSHKGNESIAGEECNSYAIEQAGSRGGMVTLYEPYYVSCMRSKGFLLDAREITSS